MKISVWHRELSDSYLRFVTQLGADALDFGTDTDIPGVVEQGYPDLDELLKMKKKIQSWGLSINRVSLPNITEKFMTDQPGGEKELENTCTALRILGEAGVPIARQRFWGDTFNELMFRYRSEHRGGYLSRGESQALTNPVPETPDYEALQDWWKHFCIVYENLVPIAEETGIKLAIHPSDSPTQTPHSAAWDITASSTPFPAHKWATSIAAAPAPKRAAHRSSSTKSTTTAAKVASS